MGRKDKPISLESHDNLSIVQLMIENGQKEAPRDLVDRDERILNLESGYLSQELPEEQMRISVIDQKPSYQSHLDLLKQGVDSWKYWRERFSEIRPFLARANLG